LKCWYWAEVVDVEVLVEGEADEEYKELDIVVEPQVDGEGAMDHFTESFSQDGVTESFSQDGVLFSLCCAWPYNCITIQRYKVCQQQSFKGFICVCGTALMRSWFSHSHWLVGRSRGEKERGGDGGAVF